MSQTKTRSVIAPALAVLACLLAAPAASAQDGVYFDEPSSSPADKEYAIPADEVREQTGGTAASDPGTDGAAPGGTGAGGGAGGDSSSGGADDETSGGGGSPSGGGGKDGDDAKAKQGDPQGDDRLFGKGVGGSETDASNRLSETEVQRLAAEDAGGVGNGVIVLVLLAVALAGGLGLALRRRARDA